MSMQHNVNIYIYYIYINYIYILYINYIYMCIYIHISIALRIANLFRAHL